MSANHGIDWDAQPLGAESDTAIAERIGVCSSVVGGARRRRRIPACRASRRLVRVVDWDAQPLGRVHDRTLARMLGVDRASVRSARLHRHIPSPVPPVRTAATPRPPRKLVRWDAMPLGEVPDPVVAKMAGVGSTAVFYARTVRGIPDYSSTHGVDWANAGLGMDRDPDIAKRLGVSVATVAGARRDRGIPAFVVVSACPCGRTVESKRARKFCSGRCGSLYHNAVVTAGVTREEAFLRIAMTRLSRRCDEAEAAGVHSPPGEIEDHEDQ